MKTNSTRLDMDRLEDLSRLHIKKRLSQDTTRRQIVEDIRNIIQQHYEDR